MSFDNLDENIIVSRNIAITKSELLNLENKIKSKKRFFIFRIQQE